QLLQILRTASVARRWPSTHAAKAPPSSSSSSSSTAADPASSEMHKGRCARYTRHAARRTHTIATGERPRFSRAVGRSRALPPPPASHSSPSDRYSDSIPAVSIVNPPSKELPQRSLHTTNLSTKARAPAGESGWPPEEDKHHTPGQNASALTTAAAATTPAAESWSTRLSFASRMSSWADRRISDTSGPEEQP
ncbi:unnamed protein product, partial [Ectocarpus sp. 12 AP-2014]